MNPTESGKVVQPWCHDHQLWLLRKPCAGLTHLRVPAAGRVHVEDATRRMVVWARVQEERDAVAHAPREGATWGTAVGGTVRPCSTLPRRRGRPEVTLDWPAKASRIKAWGIASITRTPKHPYVGTGRRLQMGRDQASPRPGRRQRLVHPRGRLQDIV